MKKKNLAIAAVALGVLAAALFSHRAPEVTTPKRTKKPAAAPEPDWREGPVVTVHQPKPDFKPAEAKALGRSLDQASIQSLIDNLRVASERDDDATMRAMIEGLRRRGAPARAMAEREMAQVPADSKSYFAMKEVLR